MSPSVESLAERYSRFETPDLEAIAESPEGDYLPEAREAARAELERRAQSGEPEELPEVPVARQSLAVTFFAVLMIFAGWALVFRGVLILIWFLVIPTWGQALWGTGMLLTGLAFTHTASVIDKLFWSHFVKTYAIVGFLGIWSPGIHLVMGRTKGGEDLTNVLRSGLMIVLALAAYLRERKKALRSYSPVDIVDTF